MEANPRIVGGSMQEQTEVLNSSQYESSPVTVGAAIAGDLAGGSAGGCRKEELVAAPVAEMAQVVESGAGKRKRGRPSKGQPKPSPKMMKDEEDVCFICFDGGKLVLCDRRNCPKAYHPACIKRDEAFFRSKAQWNCGWHICSSCEKAALYMCYTCTYSLCKVCITVSEFLCVRGTKGLCAPCMKTIMLFENSVNGDPGKAQVDFDDQSSWEYLFKVYWIYLKRKLSLTLEDLIKAKNPWKGASVLSFQGESSGELYDASNDYGYISDVSSRKKIKNVVKRKMGKQSKFQNKGAQNMIKPVLNGSNSFPESEQWASKELLEFIAHMRDGDTSYISQFEIQTLLLEYIKRNNLRDPRRKSQIICDLRLGNVFGKARVGHIEMLKRLECHLLRKEKNNDNFEEVSVGNNDNQVTTSKNKKSKALKTRDSRRAVGNFEEFAAIDVYNVNLIYIKRSLMENLIDDAEKFSEKVVGAVVRIRVFCEDKKHNMYRLVQVVGTSKAATPYKFGQKTANVMLEILNLNKKEAISIDAISNQDFSEDECKDLCRNMKCSFSKRLTVGEIQEKAVELGKVKLPGCVESEKLRLSNLSDLTSEIGRKEEHGEYVEKLEVVNNPKEHHQKPNEIPKVHTDSTKGPASEPVQITKPHEKEEENNANLSGSGTQNNNSKDQIPESSSAAVPAEPLTSIRPPEIKENPEIDNVWNYQDPHGRIQGPFCIEQLSKWDSCGFFPTDLKIWKTGQTQVDSIFLTDILAREMPLFYDTCLPTHEVSIDLVNTQNGAPSFSNVHPTYPGMERSHHREGEEEADDENNTDISTVVSHQSCGQNWRPPLLPPIVNWDLNSSEPSKEHHHLNCFTDAPFPTPNQNDLNNGNEHMAENRPSVASNTPGGSSWGSDSSLAVSEERNPEWDTCPVSATLLRLSEVAAATPSSGTCQVSQHQAITWQGLVGGPNEFASLNEESVSDLLAEVAAMESNGVPSPTSKCNSEFAGGCKTDFFGSIQMVEAGKNDALSSTGDLQFPFKLMLLDEGEHEQEHTGFVQGNPNNNHHEGSWETSAATAITTGSESMRDYNCVRNNGSRGGSWNRGERGVL